MNGAPLGAAGVDAQERRRQTTRELRVAILRLRLAEFAAAEYLPTQDMRELTEAVDRVVAAVRAKL